MAQAQLGAPTRASTSVVDYDVLPGPGAGPSKLPAVDAKYWTLKVALSQRPWSFVASAGMAINFVCSGLTPVVVGMAVDQAIATGDLTSLFVWVGVPALVFITAIAANWVARYMLVRSQQLVGHDLRTAVTDRIQDPRGFAGRERTAGGLLSIASSDTHRVGEVVMMTVFPVAEVAAIVYGASVMFTVSVPLGFGVLIGGPAMVVIATYVARPLQRRSVKRQHAIAQAAAMATDVVQGLRIIKGLGAVVTVRGRYSNVSNTAYQRTVEANAAEARLNGTTEAVGAIFVASVGVVAGYLALGGGMSIGELITVVGLTQFLIMPMTMLGRNVASRWASAEASGKRIRGVLSADYERLDETEATRADRMISRLPVGLTVIHADGTADSVVRELENLPRSRVIVAPHAADLFDGTVMDNVFPDPDRAELAIHVASCEDIPGGPTKRVGEGGRMLSGGQRQRVALARAIAFNPEVLVLQDPTTAVDSVTEQNIADRVQAHRHGQVGGQDADLKTVVFSQAPAWNAVADQVLDVAELVELIGGEE